MRRVLSGLFVFLFFLSGCSLGNTQLTDQQAKTNTTPAVLDQLPAFKVQNADEDLQRSKNYFSKVKDMAVKWHSDVLLARVEIDYKTVSNTAAVVGRYYFVSDQDKENILEIVVTGSGDNDIKQGLLNRTLNNLNADYFQVIPMDSWKTTAAKALEIVDNQGGGVAWRSSLLAQAKQSGGSLDYLHAILSLSKINDKLVWSVTYLIPMNEKKGLGQWENGTFANSVFADSGEIVG